MAPTSFSKNKNDCPDETSELFEAMSKREERVTSPSCRRQSVVCMYEWIGESWNTSSKLEVTV